MVFGKGVALNTVTETKLDILKERFILRDDVFAEQWSDETRKGYRKVTAGSCDHTPECLRGQCSNVKNVKLGNSFLLDHLKGTRTIGVFQLGEENRVKWLCFDIDVTKGEEGKEEEVRNHTKSLCRVLYKIVDKTYLVERSGSKGYHIWVFFHQPVAAEKAYIIGRWVDSQVPPPDGIHVEVFPKQTTTNKFGSLVKLPLGIHRTTGERCFFVDNTFTPYEDQWDVLRRVGVLVEEHLDLVIKRYGITAPTYKATASMQSSSLTPMCLQRVMDEGVTEGLRDVPTFSLACFYRSLHVPVEMTHAAFESWNMKNNPPLDPIELDKKIQSAYTNDYSYFPCGKDQMDSYCSSSCRFWNNKVKDRWTRYKKPAESAVGQISRD